MAEEGLLIGISQLGAVFAGFIAMASAFARRDGRLTGPDALRTRSILFTSFSAIFGALIPLVLHANALPDALAWQYAAMAGLVIGLGFSIEGARQQARMSAEDRAAAGILATYIPWTVAAIGLAFLIPVALGHENGSGLYLASIAIALLVAGWNFISLVSSRWL